MTKNARARKFKVDRKAELDTELLDNICMISLQEHYNYTVDNIDEFILHQKGHPDDYQYNVKLKDALTFVLDYYGLNVKEESPNEQIHSQRVSEDDGFITVHPPLDKNKGS